MGWLQRQRHVLDTGSGNEVSIIPHLEAIATATYLLTPSLRNAPKKVAAYWKDAAPGKFVPHSIIGDSLETDGEENARVSN